MKKLLFFITDITTGGGTERALITLVNKLADKNFNIYIYSLYRKNTTPLFEINKKIKIEFLKSKHHIIKLFNMKNIAQEDPSAIKIIVSMGRLSIETALLFKLFKITNIFLSEHTSFESYRFLIRKLKLLSYRLADKVIVLTEHDKKLLNSEYNLNNIYTIPNINPYEEYKYNFNFDQRKNIALAIGRLCYAKNFERLIQLWSKANTQNWKLLIVGDGNDRKKLEKTINETGVKNIEIFPFTKDIISYYQKAKLYLMTSRFEGLPMVLIESQHFSIPIISFNCKTGPSEIVKNDYNGYLVDYNNDSLFIEKLDFFIRNESLQRKLAINSPLVSSNYSSKIIINMWENILSENKSYEK
ncbi:glycosyltransferase family 4 protein [Proteus mirabilis]|uniref:Glycosyltransferase family 4 protein n=2 Tax=Proteus mirabilis TaxID=584 RepID=A0A385JMR9_PROMI|nr:MULTISPECIES: glycosyltransferase family 4 protein [Proteus]SVJ49242.1 glycosyl transferase [Klebsiella pneumoniae]AXY99625.1 gt2 [Proteus mirabilis]EKU8117976.1 glycosyltransferase family 4 protein [Proteus mirabilis]EKU9858942.1 glycosyltransferase family 4 protein [Proteus mirabilis]EKW3344492.1 glycosyltransferase family 4 protein [Proteus mirabilis]